MKIFDLLKSRFISHSPFILTHQVTSLCNCRCKLCDIWKRISESKYDLTKEEIIFLIKKAKQSGIIAYTVWAAEPLLRKDLSEILQFAKQNKLITTVYTNGYFLEKRFNDISPFTDLLFVSIDSNDELHDEMRGVKGIRERAIDGIRLCKEESKMKVIINSVVCNLNLDKIEGLVELSKELDVPISFEPMHVKPGYSDQFQPTSEELETAFSKIINFKKSGYSIINSVKYLSNFTLEKRFVCHYPKIYVDVDSHGNISSCSCNVSRKIWDNIKEKTFMEIFNGKEFKEFCKRREKCNNCNIFGVIESSIGYSLNPLFFLEKISSC